MKNKFLQLALSCMFLSTAVVHAQKNENLSCRAGKYILSTEYINKPEVGEGTLITAMDTTIKAKSNLLITGERLTDCKCNDSTAVFFYSDMSLPGLNVFVLKEKGWVFSHSQSLPSEVPPVGYLIPDKKYEWYTYSLQSPEILVANMKRRRGDCSDNEEFEIRYKIDAVNKKLVIESKTKMK